MAAAPGEGVTGRSVTAPTPTSAFAPPPKTLAEVDGGGRVPAPAVTTYTSLPPPGATFAGEGSRPPPGAASAPGAAAGDAAAAPPKSGCLSDCDRDWQGCKSKCAGRACDECERTYVKCGKGCFH